MHFVKLAIGNLKTRLADGHKRDEEWLAHFLTFRSGSDFKQRAATMYSSIDKGFPTGLLDLVLKQAREEGFYVELMDGRTPRPPPDRAQALRGLMAHQEEAVEALLGAGAGIAQHATGAGKTRIAQALLALYRNHHAVMVVPSKGLLKQFAKSYREQLGRECGVIGDGQWSPAQHTVATFQSLYADLQGPRRFDYDSVEILLVDEVHGAASSTFWEVAMAFRKTFLRAGFSATAFDRLDKKGLYVRSALGPVVHELKPGAAAEAKIIAKPTIVMRPFPQPPLGGSPHVMRTQAIVGNGQRNLLALQEILRLPKPCLAFVREIAHGELVHAMASRHAPSVFVHGELPSAEMASRLRAVVEGRVTVMVASPVMNQGIDVPNLASIVNLAAGMSAIQTLQKIGRGTRMVRDAEGKILKDSLACVDLADEDCGCKGATHASCAMFNRWTSARRTAYAKAGYLVL